MEEGLNIILKGADAENLVEALDSPSEPNEALKKLMSDRVYVSTNDSKLEFIPQTYQVIADQNELKWFFDHVIYKPAVNESYSAVFVCRHKKLTEEEKKTLGLTRKESEFLATQTFRRKTFKDALYQDEENNWLFDRFLATLKRFNVDKGAYTTSTNEPLPEKTLVVIFYVNPCDDIKVIREFVTQYMDVNQAISKAMLGGKTTIDNLQSYQWFGRAETNIKHLKANCKGTKYWTDYDIDVPSWWKDDLNIYNDMIQRIEMFYKKGDYVVVSTSGGYHILVRNNSISFDPHKLCKELNTYYNYLVKECGKESYLDDKGNEKFECVLNDSQIPGIPLPGTYQYGRPVTVLNKEDFK